MALDPQALNGSCEELANGNLHRRVCKCAKLGDGKISVSMATMYRTRALVNGQPTIEVVNKSCPLNAHRMPGYGVCLTVHGIMNT